MTPNHYDVTVVGGGIIGLSTAMHLLERFPSLRLAVLEKESELSTHQTGHNSGVIHSGIYYRPGSLKAEFCVEGRASITRFCDENGITYDRCGKVIVATSPEQLPRLQSLYERGAANQVEGLEMIGPEQLREIEPHTSGIRALRAPNTAIVNFQEVAAAYARNVEASGGAIRTATGLKSASYRNGRIHLSTTQGHIETRYAVNCAGLQADRVAEAMGVRSGVKIIPFRGEYFKLSKQGERLVRGLVYPVPDPRFPFLGVHFTKNVKGYFEAGPNAVLATAREGYRKRDFSLSDLMSSIRFGGFWRMAIRDWRTGLMEVNRSLRKRVFVRDLQRMIPAITQADLGASGSGVRAQAVDSAGRLLDDFSIVQSESALHVLNAPSPGATSSLVIGRRLADMAAKSFSLS